MQNFIFYLSAALILFCAVRTVSSPYIFRSALFLAGALSLTAVQYVLMEAYFVAVVQILVYVGAVIILIVFAVMLTAQLGASGHVATTAVHSDSADFPVLRRFLTLDAVEETLNVFFGVLESGLPTSSGFGEANTLPVI